MGCVSTPVTSQALFLFLLCSPPLQPLCNGQMRGPILQRASGFLNRPWIESAFVEKLYIPFHHWVEAKARGRGRGTWQLREGPLEWMNEGGGKCSGVQLLPAVWPATKQRGIGSTKCVISGGSNWATVALVRERTGAAEGPTMTTSVRF